MNTKFSRPKLFCCKSAPIGLFVLALVLFAGTPQPLSAQSNPPSPGGPADPGANKDDKAASQAAPSQAPAPAAEGFKLGNYDGHVDFEVGYRWSPGVDGNEQMFRSQINLFQGARLLNSNFSLRSTPGTGLFDKLDLSVNNIGDPYSTVRFSLSRMDLYDFRASYRDLNYYNFISSFANPLLARGNPFAQHNLNVDYRTSDFELRLFPNHKIVPFVGYARNSSSGPGFTTVEATGNEFLLNSRWLYTADLYRGGVQFNFSKLNLTLEQGYQFLRNDSAATDAGQPQGNENNPTFIGVPINLTDLNRGYHGRTKLPTSKVLAKFSPFQNLRMTARYMYSMGDVDSDFSEIRSGSFVDLNQFLAYGAAADGFNGRAKKPNHNGSFLIEFSPFSRLTFTDNVDTLDYHISGAALLSTLFLDASSLLGPSPKTSVTATSTLDTLFSYNEVRNQAEVDFDLGYGFSARAGHRYTFVDVLNNDSDDTSSSDASRNAVLVGLTYRPGTWLRLGFDYEKDKTNVPLTRTDLLNYDQFNFDWRLGSWKGLGFNGRVAIQRNTDPNADINFSSHNQNYSAGLTYDPSDRYSLGVDFSRTNIFSDLLIVIPQNFQTVPSIYNERVSAIGGRLSVGIYRGSKAEFGYRGIINRGNAPIDYHQPYASLWFPLGHKMALKPSWQFFDYTESGFPVENYKTHLLTFSLVYSR